MQTFKVTCTLPSTGTAAWVLPIRAKSKRQAISFAKRGCTVADIATFTAEPWRDW